MGLNPTIPIQVLHIKDLCVANLTVKLGIPSKSLDIFDHTMIIIAFINSKEFQKRRKVQFSGVTKEHAFLIGPIRLFIKTLLESQS